ncbi:MAG: phosphate ABC transporter permease subunit PstC [Acidobacteriota bacterium]
MATIAGLLVVLIAVFVSLEAWPALRRVGLLRFFTDPSWHPTEALFGMAPMLAASLAVTAGAVLVATPLGILSACFARFWAPSWIADWHRRALELLAGIPSVVYGLWGLDTLVPLIARWQPPGASLAAALAILSLMILPTVALTSTAALRAVDPDVLRGGAALGLDRTAIALRLAVPAARGGIATGVVLATARALGETMAVLMVAGNVVRWPTDLLGPVRPLTVNLALEMAYATADHRAALFVGGVLLVASVAVLVAAADRLDPEGVARA